MGYMRHHAIVITGPQETYMYSGTMDETTTKRTPLSWGDVWENVHRIAGQVVTPAVASPENGYVSFMVAPDGSKEGWKESHDGDRIRDHVIAYLDSLRYGDGSTQWDYVEVQYGDEEGESVALRHSDEELPRR